MSVLYQRVIVAVMQRSHFSLIPFVDILESVNQVVKLLYCVKVLQMGALVLLRI